MREMPFSDHNTNSWMGKIFTFNARDILKTFATMMGDDFTVGEGFHNVNIDIATHFVFRLQFFIRDIDMVCTLATAHIKDNYVLWMDEVHQAAKDVRHDGCVLASVHLEPSAQSFALGHAGFEACYDAILEYDRNSDTFRARYLSRSASNIVNGISWERIRKPPVMTSPSELYIPDVLNELRPGDHIEIQWRMNQNWPYEWWYAIVGHADNCISENQNCSCHLDEMFWIEFRQYPVGSTWRRFQIRRNRATEVGSASDGFYGGIRKLTNMEDINAWLQPSLESDGQWSF
ncbi:F-box protein At2g26850 isoform X4 [Cryptomeria japonica]|uniref:F-box protein At2g26850 isoform X4 n=1 Tax=Cryptomeria japonica TaxID=3369 RepID=UPI0025AD6D67|nr:F-box protein At2g26850 isoform X4 [Cryptomeria japonica]